MISRGSTACSPSIAPLNFRVHNIEQSQQGDRTFGHSFCTQSVHLSTEPVRQRLRSWHLKMVGLGMPCLHSSEPLAAWRNTCCFMSGSWCTGQGLTAGIWCGAAVRVFGRYQARIWVRVVGTERGRIGPGLGFGLEVGLTGPVRDWTPSCWRIWAAASAATRSCGGRACCRRRAPPGRGAGSALAAPPARCCPGAACGCPGVPCNVRR